MRGTFWSPGTWTAYADRSLVVEFPDWVAEFGRRAHARVAADLTHEHFVRQLNRLATDHAAQDDRGVVRT